MADRARLPPSLWAATAEPAPDTPPLEGEHRFDIAIVGGGFTGLSAALHAAQSGARAVVLEAAEPGWGASGRNGGQVIPGLKWDPDEIVRKFGAERGERIVAAVGSAAEFVYNLIRRHGIACDLGREGWIQGAHSLSAFRVLERRARQWQARGAPVELLGGETASRLIGARGYAGGLLDRRGGRLQPLSYARGLARAAQSAGALVCGRSPAISLLRQGGGWLVETPDARVRCDKVLLATNAYADMLMPALQQSLLPVASFIVATEPLTDNVRATILPEGHVMSDTRKLLAYARLDGGRLMVGGRGSYHDPRSDSDFHHVETLLRQLYPQVGDPRIAWRWSGRVAITPDFLPHVHEPMPGFVAVAGYNGRGVAMASRMGAAAARYMVGGERDDLILPISPVRPIPFHGLRRLYLAAATTWYRLQDRLSTVR